jgi:hypothetical protein
MSHMLTKGLFKSSGSKVNSEGPKLRRSFTQRRQIRVTIGPNLAKSIAMRQIPQLREKTYKPAIVLPAKAVQESEIKITSIDGRFSLLRPKSSNPDTCQVTLTENPKDLLDYLKRVTLTDEDDLVTFDTETTGTRIFGNKDFRVVSLGVSHGYSALSLDTREMTWSELTSLLREVRDLCSDIKIPLAAHNLFYDSSAVAKYLGSVRGDRSGAPGWMNYRYCTYALFRYLSSEGFVGQSHSLKFAMTDLLLWQDTNEKDQHDWLINNGYVKGPRGIHNPKNKTPEADRLEVLRGKIAEGKQYKPDKGMMYKVPHEILGKYNALDCFATYRLYRDVLLPAMNKYTTSFFKWWHSGPMMMSIRNAVDNYQNGIFVDKKILEDFKEPFRKLIKDTIFYDFKKQYPEHYMAVAVEKFEAWEKKKYPKKDYKCKGEDPPAPPKVYRRKDGRMSAAAMRYELKMKRYRAAPEKVPTKELLIYRARRKQLIRWIREGKISTHFDDKHWAYKTLFNPGSTDDKQKFLYYNVEYEVILSKYKDKPGRLRLTSGIEVDMSDSGGLPTGKSAVLAIGGKKHPLNRYTKDIKRLQFVDSCYAKICESDDGLLYLGYKVPGTNTQRNSGDGGLNLQNLVKDPAFLRAWRPRNLDTHLLCQIDESSVEPHILTEFSRCSTMMKIYGPGAKPNDIYIFNAVGIGGILAKPFLDVGYDPNNPTKEAIKEGKSKFKDLRNVSKSITLSDDYGSSARKKWQTLKIQGFNFSVQEVEEMHNNLKVLYKDKVAFGDKLRREWEKNKGWILDGFGMPVCIDKNKIKDCTNRCVQRSAALILTLWQHILIPKMWENNIDYNWMIYNFHDEMVPEIRRDQIGKMKELYKETLQIMNDKYLGGMIKIKAEPQVATCLAEIKVENYVEEELKHLLEGVE